MKTTKAHMRKILRTLQKMQFDDKFGRNIEINTRSNENGEYIIYVYFVYHLDKTKCDVHPFNFYEFWDKETNDKILTEIQNHINGYPKIK